MIAGGYPETWVASTPQEMKAIHRRLRKQFERERLLDEEVLESRGALR